MFKYYLKSFKITNDNIIIATPLMVFLLILSVYLGIGRYSMNGNWAIVLLVLTMWLMVSAFLAGWFYMVKRGIDIYCNDSLDKDEKAKESLGLLKEFTIGVGEYFVPFLSFCLLYFILAIITFALTFLVGEHFIGKIGIDFNTLSMSLGSAEAMKNLINSLSIEQLTKLNNWNMLMLGISSIFSFVTLLWIPTIIYKVKNPLKALWSSLKSIVIKPLRTFTLFIYITILNMVISIVNTFSMVNQIFYFIMTIVHFYFLVYAIVLLFFYYAKEFVEEKSYCDSRSDSIGQDEVCDTTGEED